jgi:hypothetical protein
MGKKKNRKKREKENQNQTDLKDSTDCVKIDQSLKSDLESDPTLNTTLEPTSRSLELYKSIHNIEARLGHQPPEPNRPEMSHPPPGYGFHAPPPGMIPPVGYPPVPFGVPMPPVPPPMAGLIPQSLPPTGLTITIPDDRPRSRERRRSRSRSRDRIRSRGRSRSPVYHGRSRDKRARSRDRTRSPSPYSDRIARYAAPTQRPMSPGEESDLIKLREQVFELENVIRLKDEQLNMKEERSQLKDITIDNLKRDLDERFFKDRETIESLQQQLDNAQNAINLASSDPESSGNFDFSV